MPFGREYLGDHYELWLGLFQSVVLGEGLFLNVDVCHKAFPKRYANLIDLLRDMENDINNDRNRRGGYQQGRSQEPFRIDLNRSLHGMIIDKLEQHLSGLDICFNTGLATGSIQKFRYIGRKPADEMFMKDGRRLSVLQHFTETGKRIRYPELPCIGLGSRDTKIPMEFCSIPDTQVSSIIQGRKSILLKCPKFY